MIIQFSNSEINVNIKHSTDARTNFNPLHSLFPTASSQPTQFLSHNGGSVGVQEVLYFSGKNSFFI